MQCRTLVYVLSAAALATTHLMGSPAWAETQIAKNAVAKAEAAVEKLKTACAPDLKSFCSTVTPGEGRLALCVMAHEDKISDACYDALLDVAEGVDLAISNVRRAAEVCRTDLEKHCSAVEAGQGRIAQCLIDKKSELSTACRAEVAGFESRMQK